MTFKEYKGLDLVAAGNEVLDRWRSIDAFGKSLSLREGAPEFIFFEGPPSANGMPGIHHVMARSIKDAVCVTRPRAASRSAAAPAGTPTVSPSNSALKRSSASPRKT